MRGMGSSSGVCLPGTVAFHLLDDLRVEWKSWVSLRLEEFLPFDLLKGPSGAGRQKTLA